MMPYAQALGLVRAVGERRPLDTEEVPLAQAVGRVAARDVESPEEVPRFDNSGMDGFALRAADTRGVSRESPVALPVRGVLAAGDDAAGVPAGRGGERGGGSAVQVMTGAPVPPGYDAVVRLEDVEVRRGPDGRPADIVLRAPLAAGDNVRPRGEDLQVGHRLLAAGEWVRPEHVLALATVGVGRLRVYRRPRLALVATGKELVEHTQRELPPGAIRNTSLPYLGAVLPLWGLECVHTERVGDEPADFRRALASARERGADVVVTTGAVSAGAHDYVPGVLEALGAQRHFHKVAIRPGKPIAFAELPGGGPAVFGLPGNPIATAVGLRFFVVPYLRAALGQPPEGPPLRARLRRDAPKPEGLRCFFRAWLEVGPRGAAVEALRAQGSSIVSSMVEANAWVVLPEAGARCPEGTEVDVHPLHAPEGGWPAAAPLAAATAQEAGA